MCFVKATRPAPDMAQPAVAPPATPLLTIMEAAELLRISRGKLYHFIWSGRLEPVRIGRRVLFTRASLERLIEGLQS